MDSVQKNFWKQLVRIDFIGSIAYDKMPTDNNDTRRSSKSKQREIEFYKGKLNQIPLFSLGDFRNQWLFAKVALGEYLNTDVDNIHKD